jgi:hypothetical protein
VFGISNKLQKHFVLDYNRHRNQNTGGFVFIHNCINIQRGAVVPLALSNLCVTLYLFRFAPWAVEVCGKIIMQRCRVAVVMFWHKH